MSTFLATLTRPTLLLSAICLSLLSACSAQSAPETTAPDPTVEPEPTAVADVVIAPTDAPTAIPEPTVAVEPTVAAEPTAAQATDLPAPTEAPVIAIEPIEPTYFTPAQGEGPYYPTEKLTEQDNDLIALDGQSERPAGEELLLSGVIYDATGMPLAGVQIEIWQTDHNGVYLHPRDPTTDNRDRNFQFYGETLTEADGTYFFRTIVPGQYEPRPTHIHYKIRMDGQAVFTSQMYFGDDPDLQGEQMFAVLGPEGDNLLIEIVPSTNEAGDPVSLGTRDIILSTDYPAYHAGSETN